MWPLNMSDAPPPEPTQVPSAFARLSSTCWRCTWSPMPSKIASISSAIALLVAREAVHVHELARRVDEPVAIDLHGSITGRAAEPARRRA